MTDGKLAAAVTRIRKEIGGAEEGTMFADVLTVCDALELAGDIIAPLLVLRSQPRSWLYAGTPSTIAILDALDAMAIEP